MISDIQSGEQRFLFDLRKIYDPFRFQADFHASAKPYGFLGGAARTRQHRWHNGGFHQRDCSRTPSCSSFASTVACMATVIANFTPTTTAALTYGYQTPSTTSIYDPLYPQWLCGTNLPSGLVTPGCVVGSNHR